MSNTDFEARLRRIAAQEGGASASAPMVEQVQGAPRPAGQKPHRGVIAFGALGISLGIFALRKANEHYDTLKAADKPEVILGLGVGGAITLLIGVVLMLKAFTKQKTTEHIVVKKRREASTLARLIFTFLGLAMGAIACLYMFAASAARHIDTQTAQQVYHGGQMIVLILLCLSLLFGFVGMFLRGYALGRVPVYCVVGAVVTYYASGFAGLNLLEWQPFVAAIQ